MKEDYEGRGFVALHDVRNAIVSASATLTGGTAATLIAGDSDYFLDIIEVMFSNNSTVSASVSLVNDGTTIRTFQVAAGATSQFKFDCPLRQNTKGLPWIADLEDVTGTSVVVAAEFIKKTKN